MLVYPSSQSFDRDDHSKLATGLARCGRLLVLFARSGHSTRVHNTHCGRFLCAERGCSLCRHGKRSTTQAAPWTSKNRTLITLCPPSHTLAGTAPREIRRDDSLLLKKYGTNPRDEHFPINRTPRRGHTLNDSISDHYSILPSDTLPSALEGAIDILATVG